MVWALGAADVAPGDPITIDDTVTHIEPLLLWKAVHELSREFKRWTQNRTRTGYGCPFIKIGHMLEELKVIPYAPLDESTHLDRTIEKFSTEIKPIFRRYVTVILKRKRRMSTATNTAHTLRYLEQWLHKQYPGIGLLNVSEKIILEYLANLKPTVRESQRGRLHLFFKWCKREGISSQNPLQNIKCGDFLKELPICSKKEFQDIIRYIKNPNTDPYQAFMLALVLFWGFSRSEVVYSTYVLKNDTIEVKPHQRPLSFVHQSPTRISNLSLPKAPLWFLELQKRFIMDWNRRFSKLKNPTPDKPLFLCPNDQHNRPMSPTTANRIIKLATHTATGKSIPMRILKMTAGHLHTYQSDASILAELGWSKNYVFNYTWMPRKYWSPKSSTTP